ncbi:hypothetical protein [Calothrix rhizosoleniae]|uniref:hypothetical protein n=1 Tax=Calothrix rhizosoleniae TaxID=888997 RepID=UPI000B4A2817|nr:hypothetical protein [Calothrix rhizosoleniae]
MKVSLKRIEATLHDLGRGAVSNSQNGSNSNGSVSFRISVGAQSVDASAPQKSVLEENNVSTPQEFFHQHISVQTFPTQSDGEEFPHLPKFKTPSFSNHRHAANPALAMNLLEDIQTDVAKWQKELKIIVRQIQDIHLEGPIVNGWLESHQKQPETRGTATLRHAEVDSLMDYVEDICAANQGNSDRLSRAGYRLCALDSAGKVWSRPCPAEQVPSVSMAIARYQKLRQILGRKQYLETRLNQLAETLVALYGHLQES